MSEGRSRSLWAHTSSVMALIANVNRDPKKSRPFQPSDFSPHAAPSSQPLPKVKMKSLKNMIMGIKPERPK